LSHIHIKNACPSKSYNPQRLDKTSPSRGGRNRPTSPTLRISSGANSHLPLVVCRLMNYRPQIKPHYNRKWTPPGQVRSDPPARLVCSVVKYMQSRAPVNLRWDRVCCGCISCG